ncbi:hypothetical protein MTO96_034002 [Rhipicephalus appendiculatus]
MKDISPYSISKAGLDKLTRVSALEFAKYGIRVNSVSPTTIDTKMAFGHIKDADEKEKKKAAVGREMPLGRLGTVDDVAHAIAFLASDDASFITGHVLPVDGGSVLSGMRDPQDEDERVGTGNKEDDVQSSDASFLCVLNTTYWRRDFDPCKSKTPSDFCCIITMSIPGLQPPPLFLSSPGHPAVPWDQWKQAFQTYMVASGASDRAGERRKAILLTCFGMEGAADFLCTEASGLTVWLCYRYWCQPFEYK